ncbi:hypothetical protein QFZ96_007541 [Paraburkholderia youngii]
MVADRMAEAVVERLEAVDVEEDRADLRARCQRLDSSLRVLDERAAVLQAGQRIGCGELGELAFEQKVIAPEMVEGEMEHRRRRRADRDDPRPHGHVDLGRMSFAAQQRDGHRVEQRAAGGEMHGREPYRRRADRYHDERRQEPRQRLCQALRIQHEPADQHQLVRDTDCAEQRRRFRGWDRQYQQRKHERAQ